MEGRKQVWVLATSMIFLVGFICGLSASNLNSTNHDPQIPGMIIGSPTGTAPEADSPDDRISQEQIHLENNRVIIDIQNPQWAVFTDTNSMDPVLDKEAHAIQIVPKEESDISVGDIISFTVDGNTVYVHRVIEIGNDQEGWYAITKGDNNAAKDPFRLRFGQITRVLVAIIY